MAEIIGLVGEVSAIVKAILDKYQQIQRCKEQCRTLAENITDIFQPLKDFDKHLNEKDQQHLKKLLNKFLFIIRDAQDIINKHCHKSFFEKVFLSNKFEGEFTDVNKRLDTINQSFSLVLNVEMAMDIKNVGTGIDSVKVVVAKANEDTENAINEVKRVLLSKINEIPTMNDSQITMSEPGPDGRAFGELNSFQAVELVYSPEMEEDKKKLDIMWKLSACEGVLTLYGLYIRDGLTYMVTEKTNEDCPTLDLLIAKGTFHRNWGVVRSMSLEIANAIGFMHKCGILHKAIRSSNICLVKDRHIRVYGFENSRLIQERSNLSYMEAREQIRWTAPERLVKNKPPYDEKCDIYSFGLLMWSLATHQVPFDTTTLRAIPTAKLPIPGNIPRDLAAIIAGCIERNREQRWTIKKIIEELSALVPENLESDGEN